jgi:hypothetical protein
MQAQAAEFSGYAGKFRWWMHMARGICGLARKSHKPKRSRNFRAFVVACDFSRNVR